MRTLVVIHPEFNFLREYIEQLPQRFESLNEVLYKDRNVIKADEVSSLKVVIKSYRRIYLTNRIRYSFFYPSKAERAYTYGLELLKKGFFTPQPVAFVECYENGLLAQSYFVSLYSDFVPLSSMIAEDEDLLMTDLAQFTYRLHQQGIYHRDFSKGNVLFKKQGDRFQFALIDNNRMRFGKFSYSRRLKNFRRLGLSDAQLIRVAKEYARLERSDETRTIERLFQLVRKHHERNVLKKRAKKMVLNFGNRLAAAITFCA